MYFPSDIVDNQTFRQSSSEGRSTAVSRFSKDSYLNKVRLKDHKTSGARRLKGLRSFMKCWIPKIRIK